MFGAAAAELVGEARRSETGQVPPYNAGLVLEALKAVTAHHRRLRSVEVRRKGETDRDRNYDTAVEIQALLESIRSREVEYENADTAEAAAVLIHHDALLRNKRCLLGYHMHRVDTLRELRWQLGSALPEHVEANTCEAEREFYTSYDRILAEYMRDASAGGIGLDLTLDATPPKDPHIEVRVLEEAGEVFSQEKGTVHLEAGTVHFLRRDEVEPLIAQGLLEHCS
eukprot:jgi/Chlat1/480/Chrsp103S01076